MGESDAQDAGRNTGMPWTVRKLRAVVLIVMILAVALFLGLRAPKDGPATGTGPTGDTSPGQVDDPTPGGPRDADPVQRRVPREAMALDPSEMTDVAEALEAADAALGEGRLYEPPGNSAIQHYRRVLELEPENVEALEGLETVMAMIVQRLETALADHDLARADKLASVLAGAFADAPETAALLERLDRKVAAQEVLELGLEQMEAGNLVRPVERSALRNMLTASELDPDNPELQMAVERLETEVVERALSLARRDGFVEALFLIDAVLQLNPDSRFLRDAAERIGNLQAMRIEQSAAAARAAMSEALFEDARAEIDRTALLGGDASLLEILEEELAHARVYGIFSPGESFADTLRNGDSGPPMVVVPAGTFLMGTLPSAPGHRTSEEPRHQVVFERGFALGIREVTVGDFRRFVDATGYTTDAEREGSSFVYNESNGRVIRRSNVTWRDDFRGREAADDLPVLHISWNDANAYAEWLAAQTGQPYRLATEAEFEYALRAGSDDPYWWGDGAPEEPIENLTGTGDRSPRYERTWNQAFEGYADGYWGPAPVASLAANPLGLHDMAGNVMEWVADCWHDSYVRAPSDGSAWVNLGCERRVARGSFWGGAPETARSAHRTGYLAGQRGAALGFRIARDVY